MKRPLNRHLLAGIMLLGLIAAPAAQVGAQSAPSKGLQTEGDISAAAFVITQSGQIGQYSLPEAPGYDPVGCKFDADLGTVLITQPGYVTVTARHVYATQKVIVRGQFYQRLASGSYSPVTNEIGGLILNVGPTIPTGAGIAFSFPAPIGPDYIFAHVIRWYEPDNVTVEGTIIVAYSKYRISIDGSAQTFPDTTACIAPPQFPPVAELGAVTGTVNSTLNYTVRRFPIDVTVNTRWDGTVVDSVVTDDDADGSENFKIPAAPMGPHTLKFTYGKWVATQIYTVKPRIKLIPSTVARDQTVNVSLRGFKTGEVVRIRWKQGNSWVQIAQVTTSGTGSANVNVKVPKFAPDGAASVRGDGNKGAAAQTNAVTVSGGPMTAATAKTPTPAALATASPTASPAPTDTPTAEATTPVVVETPTAMPGASPVATN